MSAWRLMRSVTGVVGARLAGAAFGLLTQFVLARHFHEADVGLFFLVMSVTAIGSLLITGGYTALSVTLLARYHSLGRHTLVRRLHAASWRDFLLLTAVSAVLIGLFIWLDTDHAETRQALLYGGIAALPYAVMRLNSTAANSLRRFALSYVPDFVYRTGLLFVLTLIGIYFVPGFSILHVISAYIVITIAVTAYQAWALGKDAVTASWQSKGRDIRPYLRPRASALVFVAIITVAFADIVTMIAGLCLPTSDVAVVGVAVRLAALAGFVTQSSQQFVIRDLTDAMTRGDQAGADALLLRVNLIVCAVMSATIVGALALGSPVLGMFGEAYTAGFWPLIIFLSGQAFRAAGGMNAYLLSLKGYQSRTAQSCALAMLVLISGIVILAPRWGITGVAVAVVLTDAVWAFHLSYLAQRCIGRRADILAVALHRLTPAA